MKRLYLFLATIFLLTVGKTSFAQTELRGTYIGTMYENPDWKLEFKMGHLDSLVITGSGIYPENKKFTFQGVFQYMDNDNSFEDSYTALFQIQYWRDYADGYVESNDFFRLSLSIEFVYEEDEFGPGDRTGEVASIKGFGVWYEKEGMDPENIEFEIKKQ